MHANIIRNVADRTSPTVTDDDPPIDPDAVRAAYWDHKAARLARIRRRRDVKRASRRSG